MLIDLSYVNEKIFKDVFDLVIKFIVVIYGNVKVFCNYKRNYIDE